MRLARLSLLLAVGTVGAVACGARTPRDFRAPAREMTFNDDCGLQAYFDERARAALASPVAADETVATNDKGLTVGEGSYILKDPLARRRFAKLLRDEYRGLDEKLVRAVESTEGRLAVRVRWWDAGQIRRLRPDSEITIETKAGDFVLPPNMCVSDLLFGEKVYAMRARYLRNEVDLATDHPGGAPPLPPEPAPSASASTPPAPSPSMSTSASASP